ncbi:MAG: NUDIX hydrolase [Planctomycetota bacterium]|nr:NUDIX hydrolase [Planctomycetota bacterium]
MAPYHVPHFPQSAVIPWRLRKKRLEVLVITSSSGRRWGIPKGLIESHLTPVESAMTEALEEAGVEGVPDAKSLGSYRYKKWGGVCEVEVFSMRVLVEHDTWDEDYRRREWVAVDAAAKRVDKRDLAKLLRRFARLHQKRS